jgi:hypothetical protein
MASLQPFWLVRRETDECRMFDATDARVCFDRHDPLDEEPTIAAGTGKLLLRDGS